MGTGMHSGRSKENGFTLVELLIVMGMLGIVMAAIFSLYQTSQRSANLQEEVVETQQNLRIAIEAVERDLRMAGYMIPADITGTPNPPSATLTDTSTTVPVGNFGNGTGAAAIAGSWSPLVPADAVTDEIILNMASAGHVYANITSLDNTDPIARIGVTGNTEFLVASPEEVDAFDDGDFVRIVRPQNRAQVPAGGTLYRVQARDRDAVPGPPIALGSITLVYVSGADPTTTVYNRGDIMVQTPQGVANPPNTVRYSMVDSTTPGCPDQLQQRCLARIVNENTPAEETQIIATNIANFQITYFLDMQPTVETTAVPDLERIRSIKVVIVGSTLPKAALGGSAETTTEFRTITSRTLLRNRLNLD